MRRINPPRSPSQSAGSLSVGGPTGLLQLQAAPLSTVGSVERPCAAVACEGCGWRRGNVQLQSRSMIYLGCGILASRLICALCYSLCRNTRMDIRNFGIHPCVLKKFPAVRSNIPTIPYT
eukprot:6194569-Pleurochrysis_carterae.AAC.1